MLLTRSVDQGPPPRVPLNTLTLKQRRLVEAIDQFTRATGEPCSAHYLARRIGVHHTTIREHLEALHRRGWVLTPNAPVQLTHPLDE
jgi:predicted ArsR family transcriptional regulator